jgi:periodic tryptophan protein 2
MWLNVSFLFTIESSGRKMNDRMTSDNNASSRYFTSVCYSADGSCILAGGNSKYVCIYECSQRILIKKFQISFNRSLDGILDELNSKNLADGGPIDTTHDSEDETDFSFFLPGAKRGDDGSRRSKVEVMVSQVSFSSSGREWALVSNEGLHIYSLEDEMIFDPISLTEEITPGAVQIRLLTGDYSVSLIMSLHLNEFSLVRQVVEATPYRSIAHVVRAIGPEHLEHLIQYLAKILDCSPHLEFYVQWCQELLQSHGAYMENNRGKLMRAFRVMLKSLQSRYDELKNLCDTNAYTLAFTECQATMMLEN